MRRLASLVRRFFGPRMRRPIDDDPSLPFTPEEFGRLIRRQGDKGLFVILSSALPSRLLTAFPPEVSVSRVPLDVAIDRVRAKLFDATHASQPETAGSER